MENNQNHEAQQGSAKSPAANKPSGNRSSRGGRGRNHHHRPSQHKASEENSEQKQQSAAAQPQAAPAPQNRGEKSGGAEANAQSKGQKSGESSRSRNRRGRGRGAGAPKDAADTQQASGQSRSRRAPAEDKDVVEITPMPNLNFGLFDSTDRLREDSFLPIHEEHKPDPEAEKFAAAILDAEGPLLFAQEPTESSVQENAAQDADEETEISEEEKPVEIVGIRFRTTGKVYFFDPGKLKLRAGSYAVVETARGLEYGEVYRGNTMVPQKQIVPPLRPVIRAATKDDMIHYQENQVREAEAFRICLEKIAAHELDMKLVEAEYTFDNTKLLFYFTSAGRVDFRELVKDLAGVFRTRIELRQIGIRDEAKLLGGLGTCGRPLCCASFLADFVQVSIKMAKEQSLSLNSTKISGCCGRLMCCLRYEADTYEEEIRRTPSQGSLLRTPDGEGCVISNNPLRGTVRVRLGGEDGTVKEYHRDAVQLLKGAVTVQEDE